PHLNSMHITERTVKASPSWNEKRHTLRDRMPFARLLFVATLPCCRIWLLSTGRPLRGPHCVAISFCLPFRLTTPGDGVFVLFRHRIHRKQSSADLEELLDWTRSCGRLLVIPHFQRVMPQRLRSEAVEL